MSDEREDSRVQPSMTFWTVKDASEIYGISIRRVRQIANQRKLGSMIGKTMIFTESELKRLKPRPPGWHSQRRNLPEDER